MLPVAVKRLLGCIAVVSLGGACSLLTSYDGFERAPPADAAVIEVDSGDAAPGDPCTHTRWPDPPASGPDGTTDALVGAVSSLSIIAGAGNAPFGFDLDGLCTCPDRGACLGALAQPPCDPVDSGIDNAGDELFRAFVSAGVRIDDTGLQAGLRKGQYGVVLRLTGYNGAADDTDVKLDAFNAVGLQGDAGTAKFDGSDTWILDAASIVGSVPTYGSRSAYVRGGVLVAEFAQLVLKSRLPADGSQWRLIELELRSAVLTARVERVGASGLALTGGTVAGRMPSAALLRQAQRSGACVGTSVYDVVKARVCDARDLPVEPGRDGRDTVCDALSAAIRFQAGPARTDPSPKERDDTSPCPLVGSEDCR